MREAMDLSIEEVAAAGQIEPALPAVIEAGKFQPSEYMRHHLARTFAGLAVELRRQ